MSLPKIAEEHMDIDLQFGIMRGDEHCVVKNMPLNRVFYILPWDIIMLEDKTAMVNGEIIPDTRPNDNMDIPIIRTKKGIEIDISEPNYRWNIDEVQEGYIPVVRIKQ